MGKKQRVVTKREFLKIFEDEELEKADGEEDSPIGEVIEFVEPEPVEQTVVEPVDTGRM